MSPSNVRSGRMKKLVFNQEVGEEGGWKSDMGVVVNGKVMRIRREIGK